MRNTLFIIIPLLFSFSCYDEGVPAVTPIANVDSVLVVLDSLSKVRASLPDPDSNAGLRIYAEELFKYRMVDTLGVRFPVLFNQPDSVISARIDSIIIRHGRPDSTGDKGKLIGARIDAFLALSLAERKARLKAVRFLGLILYASRNQLIGVVERREYTINSATKRQAIKKLVIGRLGSNTVSSIQAFEASDIASFDNRVAALRSQYFEREIR